MIQYALCSSPFGALLIGWDTDGVVSVRLTSESPPENLSDSTMHPVISQLQEYFSGIRKDFDLTLAPKGTPFQKLVWRELMNIPYGQTRTYGEIAAAIKKPGAARAVGMACNKNPIWLLIPCHRVVGKSGSLTGYAGGLPMKHALLELEQAYL